MKTVVLLLLVGCAAEDAVPLPYERGMSGPFALTWETPGDDADPPGHCDGAAASGCFCTLGRLVRNVNLIELPDGDGTATLSLGDAQADPVVEHISDDMVRVLSSAFELPEGWLWFPQPYTLTQSDDGTISGSGIHIGLTPAEGSCGYSTWYVVGTPI